MNSASELHNVNLGWCNLRVMFHSVCLSIFQALTFKITAREKCAQGKPSTTAYFAIFHKYRSPVRNTLSWDQRTKNHLVVAKARLGLHHTKGCGMDITGLDSHDHFPALSWELLDQCLSVNCRSKLMSCVY